MSKAARSVTVHQSCRDAADGYRGAIQQEEAKYVEANHSTGNETPDVFTNAALTSSNAMN